MAAEEYCDAPSDPPDRESEREVMASILLPEHVHPVSGDTVFAFDVFPRVPDGFRVVLPSALQSGSSADADPSMANGTVSLAHLPPLRVNALATTGYPSARPPRFLLLSSFLSVESLVSVARHLLSLAEPGSPCLFVWQSFLEEELLSFLGFESAMPLAAPPDDGHDPDAGSAAADSASASATAAAAAAGHCASSYDCEAFGVRCSAGPVEETLQRLEAFDGERAAAAFLAGSHECMLCYATKLGTAFSTLLCGHAFCTACLQAMCEVNIRDGRIRDLLCPEPDACGAAFHPSDIKALVPAAALARYESLLLEQSLAAMEDVKFCPQKACSKPVVTVPGSRYAACQVCGFEFCVLCSARFHGSDDCSDIATKLENINRELERAGGSRVGTLKAAKDELESLLEISRTTTPCGHCGMAISRIDGCNKMTCTACGGYSCYRCGCAISGYDHFQAGKCGLWEAPQPQSSERAARVRLQRGFLAARRALRSETGRCPQCHGMVLKENSLNHVMCFNCGARFCFLCSAVTKSTKHFIGGACKQHS